MELDFLNVKDDINIVDSFAKADSVINNPRYKSILCSVSGGSDSDIMLDLIYRVDISKKVKYIWFNTGIEYQATKDHLDYLEEKYDIEIIRERAIKPIPITCREYGQPFLNKFVSEQISRLQKHNFKWEDRSYNELVKMYPKCKSAIKWFCNQYTKENNFEKVSRFDIGYNKYLREFLIANPPNFRISSKCCYFAKKNVSKNLEKEYNADLQIVGVRQAEGGIRSTAYKNCYSINDKKVDTYRPIFWYKENTKERYEKKFNIIHSDCYKKYGFKRTGCCCCPYGRDLEEELKIINIYEPMLYRAVCNIFKDSYEYTRKYIEFVAKMKQQDEQIKGQRNIYDYIKNP